MSKATLKVNVELNTLDDFLCISVHELGYLDPIFLIYPNAKNILKQVYFDPHIAFILEYKASLEVKCRN